MAMQTTKRNPETNEQGTWMPSRYSCKCVNGCALPIAAGQQAFLVKRSTWEAYHVNCAPKWAIDPKNTIKERRV